MKILVTGATGFVGSHLARELQKTNLDVTYMIRGDSSRLGFEAKTISASLGDKLDLNQLKEITHVVNVAAQAKWGNDDLTNQTNVLATGRFMDDVAQLPNLQRVIHVGTAFTAGRYTDQLMAESFPQVAVDQFNVYTQSKNTAQHAMLSRLSEKLTVIAPSIIVGHTQDGCKASTQIYWLFSLVNKLEAFTFDLNQKIDVVPVDWVVERIMNELLHPSGKQYIHATAGHNANTFREIYGEYDRIRGTNVVDKYTKLSLDELAVVVNNKYQMRMARTLNSAIAQYSVFAQSGITFATEYDAPPFTSYLALCDESINKNLGTMIRDDWNPIKENKENNYV